VSEAAKANALPNSPMTKEEAEAVYSTMYPATELRLGHRTIRRGLVELGLPAIMTRAKPPNFGGMTGRPMPPNEKTIRALAALMPWMFIVPALMTTPTTASTKGSLVRRLSCAAARNAPSVRILLELAHPPSTPDDRQSRDASA